jgi:hypothetical protein
MCIFEERGWMCVFQGGEPVNRIQLALDAQVIRMREEWMVTGHYWYIGRAGERGRDEGGWATYAVFEHGVGTGIEVDGCTEKRSARRTRESMGLEG